LRCDETERLLEARQVEDAPVFLRSLLQMSAYLDLFA